MIEGFGNNETMDNMMISFRIMVNVGVKTKGKYHSSCP